MQTRATLLVTALAVALIAVFLRNADLARVWMEVKSSRADLLALSLVLTAATMFIRAERWQYLLAPLGHTRFWVAFRMTVIGFAASFVLPARAGEVLRPYLLARSERLPPAAAFATIVVERTLDLLTVILLLTSFFLFFQGSEAASAPTLFRAVLLGALAIAPVALTITAALFVMAGHPGRVDRLVLTVERLLPSRIAKTLASLIRRFAEGLAVVRSPSRLLWAMGWSLILWVTLAAQTAVVLRAFEITLPLGGSLLLTAMVVVGVSVPTPGGIGGSHEALRLGLTSFYSADNDAAVGAAIVLHGVNFAPHLVLGLWFVAQGGLSMKQLSELSASARNNAGERDGVS